MRLPLSDNFSWCQADRKLCKHISDVKEDVYLYLPSAGLQKVCYYSWLYVMCVEVWVCAEARG